MATYNFTTSGSNWSLVVDGATKGPWPRHANGISSPLYKVDTTGTAIVLSVNAEPYYSTKIRSTDTVQINGVEKTGTLTDKEMAIESEAIAAEATGGASEVTVYQRKTVLTDAQIKALPTAPVELVPAPGVDKIVQVVAWSIALKNWAANYTNINADALMFIQLGDWQWGNALSESNSDISSIIAIGRNSYIRPFGVSDPVKAGFSEVVNRPLYLVVPNGISGDFTGGHPDSTLIIDVLYSLNEI